MNFLIGLLFIRGNNIGFRNYLLTHETSSLGYEILKSITEKSGDNSKSFNPTVFNYESTNNQNLFQISDEIQLNIGNLNYENTGNITGDFDGDGKMDFILYPTTGVDAKKKYWLFDGISQTNYNIGSEHNIGLFTDIFTTSWLNQADKLMPMNGWCVVQLNSDSGITTFKNFSKGESFSDINHQYDKSYTFPRITYVDGCPNLPHCDLVNDNGNLIINESFSNSTNNRDRNILDPIDVIIPEPSGCPNPTDLQVSEVINGQATFSWTQTGNPAPSMWEVCFFEVNTQPIPSNSTPIGTYFIVNQNFFTAQNLDRRKNYSFFVRAICNSQTISTPSNWVGPVYSNPLLISPPGTVRYHNIPKEYISGDFNGDGLTDVIVIEKRSSYMVQVCQANCFTTNNVTVPGGKTYFVDLDRRLTSNDVFESGVINITIDSKFIVADINGDGKSNLLVFNSGNVKTYTLNNNNQLELISNFTDANILTDKPVYMGDFNGDGKMDFVIPKARAEDNWFFFFSTGIGFQKVSSQIGAKYFTSDISNEFGLADFNGAALREVMFIPNDINGDGKTDIIVQINYTCHTGGGCVNGSPILTTFLIYENIGFNGTAISFGFNYVYSQTTNVNKHPIPIFLNHNNNNQNLEYALISDSKIRTFKATKDNRIDTALKEIIIGNGVKEVITYGSLKHAVSNVDYQPSTLTETYPNFDIKQSTGFKVVSKIEQVSAGQYKLQKFRYFGAVSNLEGLGFLGFRSVARTNWHNSENPIISSVSKHDITKRGAVSESHTVLGEVYGNLLSFNPSHLVNTTLMSYEDEVLPNKVYKIKNTHTQSINALEGTSIEVTTSFDMNNNPLTTTTLTKNGSTVEKSETVVAEYFANTSNPFYVVGRIRKKNTTVTHNGDTMTGEEIYTYNPAQLVSRIQKKGHQTNYLTEDNIYDVFGNITRKTITAVGLPPRVTNYTYDPSGRFMMTSADIEGLVTSYTYNTSNGLLQTETLPSNAGFPLTTSYQYDVWGKIIRKTDFLGKSSHYSYAWLVPGTVGFISTSVLGDDESLTFAWIDDLGRKIASGYRTINNSSLAESNNSWTTYEYDIYGRAIKAYEPKLSWLPAWDGLFSSSSFDVYGRPTQIVEHTGKTTSFSYDGLTTSSSDGVSNSVVVKNSLGNIISSSDNGGTIVYQHYANGNLKQSNFSGVIVAVEQDGWGRKTKLSDPSAGIYTYHYNEFGELTKEITPKGETTYLYDSFGKLTQKTIIGNAGDPTNTKTVYQYHTTTKLLTNTRFDDFTAGFHTLYTYQYDHYKRVIASEESGAQAIFQRATTFDAFGRPENEGYIAIHTSDNKQSTKWVKNTYKNGHHWQILDLDTQQVLWQTTKVNARGQLTNGNYGNGIAVANTFDTFGFPTQFKHDRTATPSVNVMTLNTSFHALRGNLNNRYNSMFDYHEQFTYDNLDRLTVWKETGQMLCNCNFNANTQGFQSVNSASVSLSNGRLAVSGVVGSQGKGTEKLVISNASVGRKINIKGHLQIHSATAGTQVRISFYSKNPTTGETVGYTNLGMPLSNGNFSFQTTIAETNLQDLYVLFLMRNPSNPSAFMALSLDDIVITMQEEGTQHYDELGRIDENNIGVYHYTNQTAANTPIHFQNTSIEPTPKYYEYYDNRSNLEISYNLFKSPIDIVEENFERLSFEYNMFNSRSTMYYGSLEVDKQARRFRKHYAAGGSMEIKHDLQNSTVEFITYIGGDAYSAPLLLKSDGTTQNYLYLHRDYLGSIVAITNASGAVVEKRLFDAWGNITRVQDGGGTDLGMLTVLDRGYTGHEHLQGIQLIHMNGRLYDPVIHRFLQPDNYIQDPYNSQCYNRYTYGLNNPLKYTDPSGEALPALVVAAIIGAVAGATGYAAYAIQSGNWSWGGFGMAVIGGAVVGTLTGGLAGASATSVTLSAAGNAAASSFAAAFFPAINIPIGDWSISISPSIAFGNSSGAGMSFGVSYSDGDWNFSGGVGIMSYGNYNGFGTNANEIRYSILANYDDGKTGFSLGTNFWRGDFNQRTTYLGVRNGDFRFGYENDGSPFSYAGKALSNNTDMYRTAAASIGIGDFDLQLNMFTGKSGNDIGQGRDNDKNSKFVDFDSGRMKGNNKLGTWKNPEADAYRLGALSVGYRGYKVGVNSEHVRDAFQNWFAHKLLSPQPGFRMLSNTWNGYFQYNTPMINKSTLW